MLSTIEVQWTDFAWELQRAKSAKAIRDALHPIRKCKGVEPFIEESTLNGTWGKLRSQRKAFDALSKRISLTLEQEQTAKSRLDKIQDALRDTGPDGALERACKKRRADYAASLKVWSDLREQVAKLHSEICRIEAHLSQAALLDFITSRRYRITPITLANAMAGLPFITWRQSITRCNSLAPGVATGLSYEVFRDLKRALAQPPRTDRAAVEQTKAYLLGRKRPISPAVRELRARWYYLRISIETAYRQKPPKAALPYRINTEYCRRLSSRSRYDQVMEEEERLS